METMRPCSDHIQFLFHWTRLTFLLWIIQGITLVGGSSASMLAASSTLKEKDTTYEQLPVPQPLLNTDALQRGITCDGCKLGVNGEMCSGNDRGECNCSSGEIGCRCKAEWIGDACQYQISKISCEKMRNCILCQVHGSGPLSEGSDCQYYCHHNYPIPLIVKTLHFQDDEHLCSFVDQSGESTCRYFFKYGQITPDRSLNPANFYIVAQQEMDCGKRAKFPLLRPKSLNHTNNDTFHIIAKNYEEIVTTSDQQDDIGKNGKTTNSFITVVIIFVFLALPVVACMFSLVYNFSSLPCGLCNVFRQSSSKYLRNVRPFPGITGDEITSV